MIFHLQAFKKLQEGNYVEALPLFLNLEKTNPTSVEILSSIGLILLETNTDINQSIEYFKKTISILEKTNRSNDIAVMYNNIGICFSKLDNNIEAIKFYTKAIKLIPNYSKCLHNLGVSYKKLKQYDNAIRHFRESLKYENIPDSHLDLSLCLLYKNIKDISAWKEYEWRFKTIQGSFEIPNIMPNDLADLKNKTLLLYSEQGFGDSLQFIRYTKLLKSYGLKKLIVICHKELFSLYKNDINIDECKIFGEKHSAYDYRCAFMSLPLFLNKFPNHQYLNISEYKNSFWFKKMQGISGKKVGIFWQGNPRPNDEISNNIDKARSIQLMLLEPLFNISGISFISLQKHDNTNQIINYPFIINFMDEVESFEDTAAIISNLDLVISVDSSVSHLTGGLNKPIWLLNRWNGCWRWGKSSKKTIWYPSMTIYRQQEKDNWEYVIENIKQDLIKFF